MQCMHEAPAGGERDSDISRVDCIQGSGGIRCSQLVNRHPQLFPTVAASFPFCQIIALLHFCFFFCCFLYLHSRAWRCCCACFLHNYDCYYYYCNPQTSAAFGLRRVVWLYPILPLRNRTVPYE